MRCLQARERAPVHPLGFAAGQVQNASVPALALADYVGLVGGPVVGQFALGAVGQLVAMPARIDLAPVQHRHTPPTAHSRATPPGTLPAVVAATTVQLSAKNLFASLL